MGKWSKKAYRLPANHGWQCREGFKSFVADRGAVRLDIPGDWTVEPGENSFKFHDAAPPNETCVLEMTVFHLNPKVEWKGLKLDTLLANVEDKDRPGLIERGEIRTHSRGDQEHAWRETRFMDKDDDGQPKEARSRTLTARRGAIQVLITFAWWPEDAERVLPAWDEMLSSLRLGEYLAFPGTRGGN